MVRRISVGRADVNIEEAFVPRLAFVLGMEAKETDVLDQVEKAMSRSILSETTDGCCCLSHWLVPISFSVIDCRQILFAATRSRSASDGVKWDRGKTIWSRLLDNCPSLFNHGWALFPDKASQLGLEDERNHYGNFFIFFHLEKRSRWLSSRPILQITVMEWSCDTSHRKENGAKTSKMNNNNIK